jgi:TRAP-type C4-dicarboxylate transport system substrate-binding protein
MIKRLVIIKMMGLCVLAFSLTLSPVNGAEKSVVIKIATLAPEGSAWIQILSELNEEVVKKTNKKVRFRIYAGGVLGDEKDMIRKMHIGQIQGAVLTSSGLSVLFKEVNVFQVPFLFETYGEVDYVISKMDPFFRKGFAENGYALLGWSEGGFVRLMSTTPIMTLNELKKVKVWTWEDAPMAEAIFNEAKVAAIPLTVPDVLVGLQTGLVDVVYAPPAGAISLQWFTKVKFLTDVPLNYLAGGIVIKKKVFSRIPPAYQEMLMESFQNHLNKLKEMVRNENQQALIVMEKHGVKILKPSNETVEEFKELSDKAMQRLGHKSFSNKVRDEVSAYLEEYRGIKK